MLTAFYVGRSTKRTDRIKQKFLPHEATEVSGASELLDYIFVSYCWFSPNDLINKQEPEFLSLYNIILTYFKI